MHVYFLIFPIYTVCVQYIKQAAELVKLNLESYGGHMKGIRDYLESKLKVGLLFLIIFFLLLLSSYNI